MDYRKPVVFGENWSESRYKVVPYFAEERAYMIKPDVQKILDLGCAAGWNMSRFGQYGRKPIGIDVAGERVVHARRHGPVVVGSGLNLPFADGHFDCIYVQHVLHHIGDMDQALGEIWRCLGQGGILFLVETVEDNALIRWGRRLYSNWMGDVINVHFSFNSLQKEVAQKGFRLLNSDQYSVLFWLWEVLPDQIAPMEKLTPLFVAIEQVANRLAHRSGAHCFLVAQKTGP